MMKKKLLILGTGGNALDVYDIVVEKYDLLGFLDDDEAKQASFSYRDHKVIGPLSAVSEYPDAELVFAIGSTRNHTQRLSILDKLGLKNQPERFPVVIAKGANVSPSAKLEQGVILLAGTQVGANTHIENFVWALQNCVFSHDSKIGAGTIAACGVIVSGDVKIGPSCYLGAGSVIKDGLTIAGETLIGAGATVVSDINDTGIYTGVPARMRS